MQKKRLNLIIGVILGIVAIVLLNFYLMGKQKMIEDKYREAFQDHAKSLTSVLVAKKDIPKGAEIKKGMFDTTIKPKEQIEPGAVDSLDNIIGMKAVIPIRKGQQITSNLLAKTVEQVRKGMQSLSMATPVGKRAVTIKADLVSSLGNMILPGDRVDVIGVISVPVQTVGGKTVAQVANVPLFQNTLVLAVDRQLVLASEAAPEKGKLPWNLDALKLDTSKKKGQQKLSTAPLITLALSPHEANLLAFVSQQGQIRFFLRSPADAKVQKLPPANWESFFQYVGSLFPAPKQPPKPKPVKEEKRIEVYRGLSKGYITVAE